MVSLPIRWAHAYWRYGQPQLLLNGLGPTQARIHIKQGRRKYIGSLRLGREIGDALQLAQGLVVAFPKDELATSMKALIVKAIMAKAK